MTWTTRLTKPVLWVVSFVLSMTLYLFVESQAPENPKSDVDLVVHSVHLDPSLVLVGENTTVKFEVSGPQGPYTRFISDVQAGKVHATVDLSGFKVPTTKPQVPPLYVDPRDSYPDLTFRAVGRFEAVIERLRESTVPISIAISNKFKESYEPGDFEAVPATVTLKGAESEVKEAVPTVYLDHPDDVERDGVSFAQLTVVGSQSKGALDSLLTPPVDRVEIHPVRREKLVYVNVSFVGHLPQGYKISNYYVSTPNGPSSTVRVRGPGGVIDKLSTIDTQIDISPLTKSYSFPFQPKNLPPRVQLLDSPIKIRVDVEKPAR